MSYTLYTHTPTTSDQWRRQTRSKKQRHCYSTKSSKLLQLNRKVLGFRCIYTPLLYIHTHSHLSTPLLSPHTHPTCQCLSLCCTKKHNDCLRHYSTHTWHLSTPLLHPHMTPDYATAPHTHPTVSTIFFNSSNFPSNLNFYINISCGELEEQEIGVNN